MQRQIGSLHDQECALLEYLEHHSYLARNKYLGINGADQRQEQWDKLTNILNAIGAPRNKQSWMRYWNELKSKARVYNAEKNKILKRTGNVADEQFIVNEKNERVLRIVGTEHKNGLELLPEVGVPKKRNKEGRQKIRKNQDIQNNIDLLGAYSLQYLTVSNNQQRNKSLLIKSKRFKLELTEKPLQLQQFQDEQEFVYSKGNLQNQCLNKLKEISDDLKTFLQKICSDKISKQ